MKSTFNSFNSGNSKETRSYSFRASVENFTSKQFSSNTVPEAFPEEIARLRGTELAAEPCRNRADFREMPIFTIDCDSTKDLDDAVSIQKTSEGYLLGVHIADVSAYVHPGDAIDTEATQRGTSIYLPTITVPMLPECLSQDICSLNPGQDRNTISVMIRLDNDARLIGYDVKKSVIRSRIKGVYSEVNGIFDGANDMDVARKYSEVYYDLFIMKGIADKLRQLRIENGAVIQDNTARRFIVGDYDITSVPDNNGAAGIMIEEFMVLANHCMADYFVVNRLPAIYRVQLVAGRMASYSAVLQPHMELALDRYLHFTSPIRRLADVRCHQVLSEHLNGVPVDRIHASYDEILEEAAMLATKRSRRAANLEKAVNNYCAKLYVELNPEETYTGEVISKSVNRIVKLSNDMLKVSVLAPRLPLSFVCGTKVSFRVIVDNFCNKLIAKDVMAVA